MMQLSMPTDTGTHTLAAQTETSLKTNAHTLSNTHTERDARMHASP